MNRLPAALAALTLAAGLPVAGCGNDDSSDTVSSPTAAPTTSSTTTRETTTATTTSTPTTTPQSTTTTSTPSGSGGGSGGTKPPRSDEDRPGHDVPPPPGSPAEQAEQFCDEHPGAC
jgi:hypothetical protein